jgi:hypothetical protein
MNQDDRRPFASLRVVQPVAAIDGHEAADRRVALERFEGPAVAAPCNSADPQPHQEGQEARLAVESLRIVSPSGGGTLVAGSLKHLPRARVPRRARAVGHIGTAARPRSFPGNADQHEAWQTSQRDGARYERRVPAHQ